MPAPANGKYIINKVAASGVPNFFAPQNDTELIQFARNEGATGANTGSVAAVLSWIATQANLEAANFEYPSIVTDGLQLNLDAGFVGSYPTINTTWYDLSGNTNNGTLVNSPTFNSANSGSIVFDGSDDYINIGIDKSCNRFTGDFAVSAWVNRSNTGGTWGNIIGDYYTNSTGNALEWQLMIDSTARLFLYNVTNGYVISPIASGFSANTWINVVVTRIGSTINLYANTNLVTSVTNTTTFGSATGNLNIGIDGNNAEEPFTGKIAGVMIYKNKGLTSTEVSQNYNAQKGRFGL